MEYPIRINKYLAHTGECTRREADTLIEKKKVTINGRVAILGDQVQENDVVEVLRKGDRKEYQYVAYYKPRGIVTHSPQEFEEDIEQTRKNDGLFPVGRLDKDSEGLIIMTNDGRVTKKLLDPEARIEKEYSVVVDKKIKKNTISAIESGVDIEGYITKPGKAKILGETLIAITITEGKRHQIRRMLAALGYTTKKLKRVRIGSVKLKELQPGNERKLTGEEKTQFLNQIGLV